MAASPLTEGECAPKALGVTDGEHAPCFRTSHWNEFVSFPTPVSSTILTQTQNISKMTVLRLSTPTLFSPKFHPGRLPHFYPVSVCHTD